MKLQGGEKGKEIVRKRNRKRNQIREDDGEKI